ncbi:hypothetical protein EJ08DRAFT_580700 [Tothia fuscella]|uniref:Xylanolytic transcriptional activator regulatory domain-containing protein n=1 Tax=Tothia fuscella TaxID=1048955 RepID=A0A9P4P179_9PEZI|nr:hypothetical protein EJ08DRAFT_580700 [Tothia fuscella]
MTGLIDHLGQIEALPSSTQAYDYDGYEPELVHHLLNIHFNRQHHNLLLIYRPLFMRDFASGGHYYSKLLLNAIMFGSSKFSPRVDIRKDADRPSTAGWQFRQRFKNLLGEAMDESSITTIQALITVASSLFAIESAAKSTAWLYSGIAFRMIVDLGLHIDGAELLKNHRITAEDLEARRRVFWGAFVFDKIHSMYFGRPVTLQETNVRVPIEFFDDYEELEQWVPVELFNYSNSDYQRPTHPGGASHSVTTFSALCRLSLILGRITNEVYSESAYNHGGPISQDRSIRSLGTLSALDGHLQQWWSELPIEIRFEPWAIGIPLVLEDTPTPTILSLHCLYHICVILLHRPYLTKGHLFTAHHAQHALICCLVAAIRLAHVARAYCHAFTVRRTPYFIAYAAYVAITILLRVSAYQQPGSTPHQCVQYCLEILSASERTNAGVRKANSVVSKLIFVVNRKGPNPFPPGLSNPPWGQVLNERFDIDASSSFKIIDSFSLSSPDTTRQRSEWEPRVVESALNGQDSRLDHQSMELDHDSAAHLLASLRTNTPGMVDIPRDFVGHEVSTPFPDIIFGLHGDDAMQPWPEFNNHLENIYDWAPSGVMSEPAPTH